jgi:hypothetical protein
MSTRTLGILQWVGMLLGAGVWLAQHYVGYNVAEAACSAGSSGWGISAHAWQGTLMAVALVLVAAAELCALAVFSRTRGADYGDGPPEDDTRFHGALPYARLHFFATAAVIANVLFFLIILLDGVATIADVTCRQS